MDTYKRSSDIAVITTFNKALYDKYASEFMSTYNWPYDLFIYSEDDISGIKELHKDKKFMVLDFKREVPEHKSFVVDNIKRKIKVKDFRFDAVRFSYKSFSTAHFALDHGIRLGYSFLVYIDADTVFNVKKPITQKDFDKLIKKKSMMTFHGRIKLYSETGFLIFNLKHTHIKEFFKNMLDAYITGEIYKQRDFTDSTTYDVVRKGFEKKGVITYNINEKHNYGNCTQIPEIGAYITHLKGKLKRIADKGYIDYNTIPLAGKKAKKISEK